MKVPVPKIKKELFGDSGQMWMGKTRNVCGITLQCQPL